MFEACRECRYGFGKRCYYTVIKHGHYSPKTQEYPKEIYRRKGVCTKFKKDNK